MSTTASTQERARVRANENAISNRLARARAILGLGQEQVASAIGVRRSTLTNYERGITPLPLEVAIRFCACFSIDPVWLGTGSGSPCPLRRLKELRDRLAMGERFSTAIELL